MQNEFFEWDNDKAITNLNKHGVSFDEARTVFDDAFVIFIEDDRERYGEQRFQAIGVSQKGKLLTVVWTQRNNKMRIISAFKATKELRRLYEKTNNARY